MDKEEVVLLRHISETLDKLLTILSKPPNKTARIFEIAATGITIFGIVSAIDVIRNWIGG